MSGARADFLTNCGHFGKYPQQNENIAEISLIMWQLSRENPQ